MSYTTSLTFFDVFLIMIVLVGAQVLLQSSAGMAPRACCKEIVANVGVEGWVSVTCLVFLCTLLSVKVVLFLCSAKSTGSVCVVNGTSANLITS